MRIVRHQPAHPLHAEPRAEAIDEIGERSGGLAVRLGETTKTVLDTLQRLDRECGELHDIETIARIERIDAVAGTQSVDPRLEQAGDRLAVGERPAGADFDMFHRPIDAKEMDREPPRTFLVALQKLHEILRQPENRRFDIRPAHDTLGEAPLGKISGRLDERRDRTFCAAHQRVQPAEQHGAETGCQRAARPQRNIADTPETALGECGNCPLIEAERGERQRIDETRETLCVSRGGDLVPRKTRQRPGRLGRSSNGGNRRQALGGEAAFDFGDEPLFAPEKMGGAGDVEEDPVGSITGGERRETPAPGGQRHKTLGRGRRIVLLGFEARMPGAGFRQCQAGDEAETARRGVHRDEAMDIAGPGIGGKRACGARNVRRSAPEARLDPPIFEPQRKVTHH